MDAADIVRKLGRPTLAAWCGGSFELRDDEQLLIKFSYRFEKA